MIFRKPDWSESEKDPRIAEIIESAMLFMQKIAPDKWQEKIDEIDNNLTIVLVNNSLNCKALRNGELCNCKVPSGAAAYKFFASSDSKLFKTTQGVAVRHHASYHVITHEVLHAFSSDSGITDSGNGFIKVGARYCEEDKEGNITVNIGNDLNESITDALASRTLGRVGPGIDAGYASQVIIADLLIGETVENNAFIQGVYLGEGNRFAEDFDKTIKTSKVKFSQYMQNFKVIGSEEDTRKSDELLRGAVEYNLRKAKTFEEIDSVYGFQQKVINIYKNGGLYTNFMENDDINRMNNLLKFADNMQKQCKTNLNTQKMAIKSTLNEIQG